MLLGSPTPYAEPGGEPSDYALRDAACVHAKSKVEKSYSGNLLVLRTTCLACGRILREENVLLGLEHLRCPVDPRLDRCFLFCPVEDGSPKVFESPCEPVRKLLETSGYVPVLIRPGPA